MGRPPNPVIVSGSAWVWVQGAEHLKIARLHDLPRIIAMTLAAGHLGLQYAKQRLNLLGVVLGSATEEEVLPVRVAVPSYGDPVVVVYGIAVEGRVPGIPCTVALFSETARNRQWMVTFGHEPLEFWQQALGVPRIISAVPGAFLVTTRENRNKMREKLFQQRKVADVKWKG